MLLICRQCCLYDPDKCLCVLALFLFLSIKVKELPHFRKIPNMLEKGNVSLKTLHFLILILPKASIGDIGKFLAENLHYLSPSR